MEQRRLQTQEVKVQKEKDWEKHHAVQKVTSHQLITGEIHLAVTMLICIRYD